MDNEFILVQINVNYFTIVSNHLSWLVETGRYITIKKYPIAYVEDKFLFYRYKLSDWKYKKKNPKNYIKKKI